MYPNNHTMKSGIILVLLALLAACTTQPPSGTPALAPGQAVNTEHMPHDIQQVLMTAEHAAPQKAIDLKIDAANMAADNNNAAQASAILDSVGTIEDHDQLGRYDLARARVALLQQDTETALKMLDQQRALGLTLTQADQVTIGEIRAEAWFQARSYLASARERIFIDGLLSPDERQKNHELIFSTLMELPEQTLSEQAEKSITSDVRGWLSLAAMTRHYQDNPLEQLTQLDKWKQLWSGHPAAQQLPQSLQMLSQVVAQRPRVIALLLPMQGDLAPYGRAIRDGILAAHYDAGGDTEIKIYDTTAANIADLLDQAKAEGAELAIGPLDRDKVTALAHAGKLAMPVLALNRTLDNSINPDLYQFGLAPEDEDDQVADEVFREGRRNALVIYPAGDWGSRNFDAFKQRWTTMGGNIVDTAQYSVQRDYSDMIKDVLDVDQSEGRANQLRRIIGQRFEFTPRRRQDIDFVFLLADPVEARKINPTLAFYYAEDIPVYATSHINEGAASKINTIDLNGIRFCDMPWKLTNTGALQQQVEDLWPTSRAALAGFFALGIDAYRLYPRLQQIKQVPGAKLFGNTGVLQLGQDNVVTRTLMWAQFADGAAVPMPIILADHGT